MSDYKLLFKQCVGKDIHGVREFLQDTLVGGNQFAVYNLKQAYCIVKFRDGLICAMAIFSDDKKLLEQYELNPIDFELLDTSDFNIYAARFGKWHFEYGSGLCFPAYLTREFAIVIFTNYDNKVAKIEKIDIISKTKSIVWENKE